MSTKKFLSIIVPSYNEAKHIAKTLDSILIFLNNFEQEAEIIVINDGSTDNTQEILRQYKSCHPSIIRLLENSSNHGKGYSVKRGMIIAVGEYCLFMDGDNSVSIEHLHTFLKHISLKTTIVIGSIEHEGSIRIDHNSTHRRILGKISKRITRFITGLPIKDTQRGFKLFTHSSKEIIFSRQTINRWGFDIELLTIARRHNLNVKELPVRWENPDNSNVTLLSYVTTFIELLKIRINELRGKYD